VRFKSASRPRAEGEQANSGAVGRTLAAGFRVLTFLRCSFFFRKLSFTAFAALTGETRHAATPAVDDAWRTCETTGREIPAGDNTVHTYKKLHAD
jgi:hypothetical protein